MYRQATKQQRRLPIHRRIRKRVKGTAGHPRLAVFRSLKHIYAQIIDDGQGRTLVSASTRVPTGTAEKAAAEDAGAAKEKGEKAQAATAAYGGNVAAAGGVGKEIAAKALQAGIKKVVFDRGGHRYHGRVKALAEAAREAGLKF